MSIRLLGHDYLLKYDPRLARDDRANGQSCGNNCEIVLDPSLAKSEIDETFIHELIEQFNYRLQLELEHNVITSLGAAFHSVIKDNSEIFAMTLPEGDGE